MCAWREVTAYVDASYLLLFLACFILLVVVILTELLRGGPLARARPPEDLTIEERRQVDQLLRDKGVGWVVPARSLLFFLTLFVVFWPWISPTFCENVKCGGNKQLLPRTQCVERAASPQRRSCLQRTASSGA
jgi:hypothetical protein